MTWKIALIIGCAQALALIPGTSRSGITLTAALFLGFHRREAAKFSFLLAVPLIAAAGLLKGVELLLGDVHIDWSLMGLGMLVSGVSGLFCIKFFLQFLERVGLMPFVIYRFILGACLLSLALAN